MLEREAGDPSLPSQMALNCRIVNEGGLVQGGAPVATGFYFLPPASAVIGANL
jgi:hypothetical protein